MKRGRARTAWTVFAGAAIVACNGEFRFDTQRGRDAATDVVDAGAAGCTTDADCPLASLHCDPQSGACFACTSDTHCPTTTPSCDPSLRLCVECETTRDCPQGKVCEPTTRRCLAACRESFHCATPTLGCDEPKGVCATCLVNADCRGSADGTRCDLTIDRCVECTDDVQCAAPTHRCNRTRGKCAECLSASDCTEPTPICDPNAFACVTRP